MAPQVGHFEGASSREKKRKEIGASKISFDGRKKKKAPEKRQNLRKDLDSKVSVVAEEDLDPNLEVFRDPDLDKITDLDIDRQRCFTVVKKASIGKNMNQWT
ncbi:hypothetical protein LWI29_035010 [Acer saccharum]|uniref:Uncharacterized protein n=1 Tax=Acer saccharum TaxID=4024 RepID=A0AA39RF02_ACESA|nr:hypothetical protein LWI29_035010 [Acer saccharum]